jgi:hypothetical protein
VLAYCQLLTVCTCRFPIVEPDHGHTKLRLSEQGLEAIRRIETPIAVVGVSLNFLFARVVLCLSF